MVNGSLIIEYLTSNKEKFTISRLSVKKCLASLLITTISTRSLLYTVHTSVHFHDTIETESKIEKIAKENGGRFVQGLGAFQFSKTKFKKK